MAESERIYIKNFSLSKKLLIWLSIIFFFGLIFYSQISYDSFQIGRKTRNESQPFVLSPEALQKMSLGFSSVAADVLWIQTIQYFGNWAPTDAGYVELPKMLDAVTKLEPKFEYPYIFACLVLPGEGFTDQAIEIGKRGTDLVPDSWQIPYYLAFAYHEKKDYASAAKYFQIAADRPDTLPIVKVLAGIYYAKANQRDVAIAIWQGIYDSGDNQFVKDRAKVWLDHYEYIAGIEQLNQAYKDKFGNYPKSLQDLVDAKILPELPQDNINKSIELDPNTGKVIDK